MSGRALVAGAGGFIGSHMVRYLKERGYWVRGADVKPPGFEESVADEFEICDLRDLNDCARVTQGVDEVYQLAADMGGIGYISSFRAHVARNNVLINAHMLEAARAAGRRSILLLVVRVHLPDVPTGAPDVAPLKEEDAYPAAPEEGYGWEKLFSEKLCQYYAEEDKLETRVARFHNVYGPLGHLRRREREGAGGDLQEGGARRGRRRDRDLGRRSPDAVVPVHRRLRGWASTGSCASDHHEPLNLGSDELVTVDGLVDLVCAIAGKRLLKRHDTSKPQGVRGRNSDNDRLAATLRWEPSIPLQEGLERTYGWIFSVTRGRAEAAATVGRRAS